MVSLMVSLVGLLAVGARADEIAVASVDLSSVQQGWGEPHKDRSVDGNRLTIAGKTFDAGLGTHAASELVVQLDGKARRFTAQVGLDDETLPDRGSVEFMVVVDNKIVWSSGVVHTGDAAKAVDLDLTGAKVLALLVTEAADGNTYDHANWADVKIVYAGAKPAAYQFAVEKAVRLTPPAPAEPRINGARVLGVRPGKPVLFKVPVTGDRPMQYSADGLPAGLELDSATGILTGSVKARGDYAVTLHATNKLGEASRVLKIKVGDTIALTPPMGWNSWNCFANAVDSDKVRSAADAMVKSGLIDHGWTYVNIDDFWQKNRDTENGGGDPSLGGPGRDAQGNIVPNPRFPDMKGLADYVHNKGMKIGLYSSPGPYTCGGCLASFGHEAQDARSYAEWGFDYLKYDWCSYKPSLEARRTGDNAAEVAKMPNWNNGDTAKGLAEFQKPYQIMATELKKQPRDIVYSMCQYGMGDVWKWGGEVGGNCWRTTGDITDTWGSMSGIGFSQAGHEQYAKPGNWNDPDMLVVGKVGWGPNLHPTRLTPNEQYTHISLWSMLASPMLIGCDMTQLDDFTLGLLTNDEVIAINQDPAGKQAARVQQDGLTEVWAKPLADGTTAIALFNRGPVAMTVTADFAKCNVAELGGDPGTGTAEGGLTGINNGYNTYVIRDAWRQKDVEQQITRQYSVEVPRHGVVLVTVRQDPHANK